MDFCTQDRSKDQPVVDKMQKKYWKYVVTSDAELHAKLRDKPTNHKHPEASAENVYSEPRSGRCGMGVH
uniref:Uncharacterized protein n=1 Tax=Bubo bubo TaxID=30461 RepID=A0A8C0EKS0_BUBBB